MFRSLASAGISALLFAFTAVGAANAQDALERAKAAGVLQVATEEQFPPYDFIKGGEHVGYNVDIFAELGKELGLEIAYTDLPWSSVLPGLEAGKYDVVAGPAAITAERQKRFRFLIPIDQSQTSIMKRKGTEKIMKSADIAGLTIGAQRAANPMTDLKAYAETLDPAPTIKEYVDYSQAYADLAAGRLDGVANGSTNVLYTAAQRPGVFEVVLPGFGELHYSSFLGRKDEDSKTLLDALDEALLTIEKDGRMATIQTKWFGQPVELPTEVPTP
ncbi:transporter substrate-binding domain-containing protein [Afifella sp. H1R]|uniref:transporter substrate-binding domain-containing protein n=1 Tax=Afifella sp. H1R TaxID=2908841 RepID=UPI001F4536A9|nr:transporter substrate-binding domain-containing protein [Afifella sp. H1R]MCF1505906.1 transporter substrate-binding domain-containing protein [Afifella sp. H1R]